MIDWSLPAGHRVPLTMCDPWMTSFPPLLPISNLLLPNSWLAADGEIWQLSPIFIQSDWRLTTNFFTLVNYTLFWYVNHWLQSDNDSIQAIKKEKYVCHGVQGEEILVSFYFLLVIWIYNQKISLGFQFYIFYIIYEVFYKCF